MRILHVICRLTTNGPYYDLMDLVHHVRGASHSVFVLFESDPVLTQRLRSAGCHVDECGLSGFGTALWATPRLWRTIRESPPHIIQTYDAPIVDWMSRIFAALARIPLVSLAVCPTRKHYLLRSGKLTWYFAYWGEILTKAFVSQYVPNSDQVQEFLKTTFGIPARKITTIKTAVDEVRFQWSEDLAAIGRARLGIPKGRIVVGCVGAVKYAKGQIYLVRAFGVLRKSYPSIELVLIGGIDPEYRRQVDNVISAYRLETCVHLLGRQYDVAPYVAAFDVFVLPSLVEGFARALVEAMQLGRPCVATRVSGSCEAITHNETGLLVEPGSEEELTVALDWMLKSEAGRVALGVAAEASVRARYRMAERARLFEVLYRSLHKRTRGDRADSG